MTAMRVAGVNQGAAPLLEVNNLSVDFWNDDGWSNVVKDVSFSVRPGEALGLVGESGCGKTTTAYSLLGYQRPGSRISGGSIHFDGRDLLQQSARHLREIRGKRISLVPQNPTTALSPGLRIGNQLVEVMQVHEVGRDSRARERRAVELLSHVRLPDPEIALRKYPHQLSGGQQQRVTIAIALACEPDLVILDEPTTGLDVTTQAQILELLSRLRAEHGMGMLYVTHNLAVLASICDRVGVMYAGQLVEDGPTHQLFQRPRHPYTRGLIASMPRVSAPEEGRSVLLKGLLRRDQLPPGCPFAPRCDFAQEACFEQPQRLTVVTPEQRVACRRWEEVPMLDTRAAAKASRVKTSQPGEEVLLNVSKVECAYDFTRKGLLGSRTPRPIVQDVSFDLRRGETLALVGESGSGKSTIARAIAGLLVPYGGAVSFEGRNITRSIDRRPQDLRRSVQLVLQNPDASLNPRQRVSEVIGRPLELFFGMKGKERGRRVEQLLEDVRLPHAYARRFPDELSGGERQRVAIARALGADPKLMICDEILSALDVSVQADVLDLLRALQVEHGIAYLFISHDLAVVRALAHRVGVLYRGKLVEYGLVEEVFSPPFHPYTHMLLSAVPEIERTQAPRPAVSSEPEPPGVHQGACPFSDRCQWKVGAICDHVAPPWESTSDTHALRCHIPLEDLAGRETWTQRGSAAGPSRRANGTHTRDAIVAE